MAEKDGCFTAVIKNNQPDKMKLTLTWSKPVN